MFSFKSSMFVLPFYNKRMLCLDLADCFRHVQRRLCAAFCPLSYILLYFAKQNFNINTSYLRSKCAISRLNNQKFSALHSLGAFVRLSGPNR